MEENQQTIPNGWVTIENLSSYGKVYNGLSGKTKDDFGEGEPYIPYVNVFKNSKIDKNELDYVRIKRGEVQNLVVYGDLIFTTSSETIEEVGMTSVFLEKDCSFYLNSFCFIYRLNNFNDLLPEFAQFLFRNEKVRYKITLLGQGSTRYNLSKTRLLKELKLIVPKSKKEQQKISQILNKVDAAICQTESIIKKYNRIKTGLMQDLLTKGIDEEGNIRSEVTHIFKDSVLGKIPVEWDCIELQSLTTEDICYGIVQVGKYTYDGVPTIAIKDLNSDYSKVHLAEKALDASYKRSRVNGGEVLISIKATTDKVDVVPSHFSGNISRDIAKLKFGSDCVPIFYKYYFLSAIGSRSLSIITVGTTRKEISIAPLKKLMVLKVPKKEQLIIVDTFISCDERINSEIKKLKKLISLKTGLMQDLLTGRVRVNHLIKEKQSAI